MAGKATQQSIAKDLERTSIRQSEAADPTASVWVGANAGTGKTHVLTMRVLRLMLADTAPERILCLTYTKAAAAEMSKRVFDTLAKWVTDGDGDLKRRLHDLLMRAPSAAEMARARTLFTAAIETPGGLKVQTLHAFAERLLQRFPLEAGVPPSFTILDEETSRELTREAIDTVLTAATRDKAGPLGDALATAIAYASDDRFDEVLSEALGHREWLDAASRLEGDGNYRGLKAVEELFRGYFGIRDGATAAGVAQELAGILNDADLRRARDSLSGGTTTDQKSAGILGEAIAAATPASRADALSAFFLTSEGTPRKSLMTKGLKTAHPDLDQILSRAQNRFVTLKDELVALDAVAATIALHRLASAVMQRYSEAKAARAALDFDDLIQRTVRLLIQGDSTPWVLYKLDGGIDHILVDESQDTSRAQWRIVEALASEFFSGTGAREEPRSLFAVGDEKQSIYSFQGAEPAMFAEKGREFAAMAGRAGIRWQRIPLNVSFRTVEAVLDAVDAVFADQTRTPGVPVGPEGIRHIAKRFGQAGLVEIWPTEAYEEPPEADTWSPLSEETAAAPVARLASRIADTIKGWLDRGETLPSWNRPIRPGDILILVRKRNPFANPMVAALKARGIAVAGADRIRLTEQIAVQDLMSLLSFLTLPEDDLSLAEVLKSPMFDLDDGDLFKIAFGRKGTLWKALIDAAGAEPRFGEAADTLKRWRKSADFMPPFELLAALLDKDGVRKRLLARLGPDAADAIDELLNLALTYDDGAPPSLAGFLHWLSEADLEIKRDMEHGRDEVRVMTVHGAKGLEAPVVFLPDTCTTASGGGAKGGPVELPDLAPDETEPPFVWPVKGATRLEPIASAKAVHDAAESAERDRLLYVAMTRARDRLYIAGFEGKKGRAAGCWYDLVTESLRPGLTKVEDRDGRTLLRAVSDQSEPPEAAKSELSAAYAAVPLPGWASRAAPREPQLAVPLAPSRLAPYETDETGEPIPSEPPPDRLAEPAMVKPAALADQSRFLRGTLTHALLEHLPSIDPAAWQKAAKVFVEKRGLGLNTRTQKSIVTEALAVLSDPAFAPIFGPRSRAEVPIVAEIPRPKGRGPALRLTGQIDRLAELQDEVLIIDYKTNRPPPRTPEAVADVYLYQLAAYRLALYEIFKGKPVRAAILWTDGPNLMAIPPSLLDAYEERLWDIDTTRLDA